MDKNRSRRKRGQAAGGRGGSMRDWLGSANRAKGKWSQQQTRPGQQTTCPMLLDPGLWMARPFGCWLRGGPMASAMAMTEGSMGTWDMGFQGTSDRGVWGT